MANVKISGLPEASAGTVLSTDTIVGVFNGITKKCKLSSINLDLLSDGTNYKRTTAAGAADANAIAAASGSTLGARLETLTGQAVKITALTAGADWADITDNISNNAALHVIRMYDPGGYYNLWIVGTSREGSAFVVSNTQPPHQTLSFQKILVGDTHKLQCKAPSVNTTITCKTILANP